MSGTTAFSAAPVAPAVSPANEALSHAISRNPATGEVLARYPFQTAGAVESTLARTADGLAQWRRLPVAQRAAHMRRLGSVLRTMAVPLVKMISEEMGKPMRQAQGEVEKCAALCEWYAEHGPAMLAAEPTQVEHERAVIEFRPLGTVLAIMPWNFPIWQALRGAAPILLAGNTFVLKPAPSVYGSALLLADAFQEAGFPSGVFELVNIGPEQVPAVIADKRIAAVTLTGSVRAGAAVAAHAGAVVKKCVLELGGSDPFIVLADADLDMAVKAAVAGRFQNTGQVCAAAKRLIIEAPVMAAFTAKFLAATQALRMGDPLDEANDLGPMARFDLRDELDAQVQKSLAEGAVLLMGGSKQPGAGNYYLPTVLAGVNATMTAFREELFGPVAVLIEARDADDALALANDSEFGLSSTIWSADVTKAKAMAAELETGNVFINGFSASDQRVAFGGVKKSGYGRELSHFGLREFCNAQTVWIDRR